MIPKCKIVATSNFHERGFVDYTVVVMSDEIYAREVCKILNDDGGKYGHIYYTVKPLNWGLEK